VFSTYGFSGSSLNGSGIGYRDDWKDLDKDMKEFFVDMCKENDYFTKRHCSAHELTLDEPGCCKEEFSLFRIEILAIA